MKVNQLETLVCDGLWSPYVFVKATTDEGIVGWAETAGPPRVLRQLIEDLSARVVGRDPRPVERIYWDLYRLTEPYSGGLAHRAIAAVENALLDVKAKALGVAVHELFGGPTRDVVRTYWSHCGTTRALSWNKIGAPKLDSYEAVAALGAEVVERGFTAFKTNVVIPGDDPQVWPGYRLSTGSVAVGDKSRAGVADRNVTPDVIEALQRLFEAFRAGTGGNAEGRLDLNHNTKPEGAIAIARALERYELGWIEIDDYEPSSLAMVKRASTTPICSGEDLYTARQFRPFFEQRALDVAHIDVPWNGFHQSKKIADMAETFGINCTVHNYYTHLATAISAQFCAAIPNVRIMETDVDDVPWKNDLTDWQPEIVDGLLTVPTGPGWGVEVDEDVIRANPWRG